jgi:acetyl-CoA acetyltransferase
VLQGAITGIGETAHGRGLQQGSALSLQMQASLAAIADAGLSPRDIDGVIPVATGVAVAEDFITNFGIPDLRFSATTPMGGASCVAAIQAAAFTLTERAKAEVKAEVEFSWGATEVKARELVDAIVEVA